MTGELRNFLSLPYDEHEQLNLEAKEKRQKRVAPQKIQENGSSISPTKNALRRSRCCSAT